MAQLDRDLLDVVRLKPGLGIVEQHPAAAGGELRLLLVDAHRPPQELVPLVGIEAAAQISRNARRLAPLEDGKFSISAEARVAARPQGRTRSAHRWLRRSGPGSSSWRFLPQWAVRRSRALVMHGERADEVALASFRPMISTSVPSRRNFSTTASSVATPVRSQMCERLTSMRTRSSASLKSKDDPIDTRTGPSPGQPLFRSREAQIFSHTHGSS